MFILHTSLGSFSVLTEPALLVRFKDIMQADWSIIHQICNSTKYVSNKDIKTLMVVLKRVFGAVDEETVLYKLEQFFAKIGFKISENRLIQAKALVGIVHPPISSIHNRSER